MNRYALWKYLVIVVAILLGSLYTLPNFFGEAPAVQVSPARATAKVDLDVQAKVEEALKGEDKAKIDAKTEALMTAAQKLGEMVYANMQAEQAAGAGPSASDAHTDKPHDDNVVDAEVKEVKKP